MLVGLDEHAVRAVVEVEIVDIRRAHVNAQSVRDLLQRHVQALGFLAINRDQKLRIARGVTAVQTGQIFARIAFPHHALGRVS